MCIIYTQPFGSNQWQEFDRTEKVMNTVNPDWTKKIQMAYRFEEMQKLKFEVYDCDSNRPNLADHDFIGWVEITLGNLVSQRVIKSKISYHNPNLKRGTLVMCAEELAMNREQVVLQLVAYHLDKKDFFGKSDPFVVISKSTESGDYVVVHKTEVIKNTLNPVWSAFAVPVRSLCNGDYERTLKLEVWDWNRSGSHELIGTTFAALRRLIDEPHPIKLACMHPEKAVNHNGVWRL